MVYHSPWIAQLKQRRPTLGLTGDVEGDILIVGAGIAGVTTAFFTVTMTDLRVVLLEANMVAHGATGHNAGQVVSYFERPFHDIVNEYGLKLAAEGQRAIMGAWDLLEEIHRTASLQTPLVKFQGYAGFSTIPQLLSHLQDLTLFDQAGLPFKKVLVANEANLMNQIPSPLSHYCTEIPRREILERLETNDERYLAAAASQKGCINSALFCEELVGYLLSTFSSRFQLAENTPVKALTCLAQDVEANAGQYRVRGTRAVLCTNGFTGLQIQSEQGKFKPPAGGAIRGVIGYMGGYIDRVVRDPIAASYYTSISADHAEPYFYLTRRQYEMDARPHDLVCVGGPEIHLTPGTTYQRHHEYVPNIEDTLEEFLWTTYRHASAGLKQRYLWHGLMGYTEGNLRIIGADPDTPSILYNLGCNGIGILPSIYGGWKVACLLKGDSMTPSIFDPSFTGKVTGMFP